MEFYWCITVSSLAYQIAEYLYRFFRYFYSFFFASPKKNQKRRPENDVQSVFGKELRLDSCATVVKNSSALIDSQPAITF